MQPNTPPPAPPPVTPTGQNPYSFLFDDQKKPKGKLFPSGNSTKQRVIIVLAIIVGLLIVGTIVMSVVSKSSEANQAELIKVAQQQTELIRIATVGTSKASDSTTKNLAFTTLLSLESSNNNLLAVYKKNGLKISKGELAGSKNSDTDKLLANAEQDNSFNAVFTKELTAELSTYKTTVKSAFDGAKGDNTRTILSSSFKQAGTLLGSETN